MPQSKELYGQIAIITDFAERVQATAKEMPAEFAQIVKEDFWDLLA